MLQKKKQVKLSKAVEYLQDNMGGLSEMAQIRNLHWWTVEYGYDRHFRNA